MQVRHFQNESHICFESGAGSVFEGLQAKKTLIVVPNALLMDNHQVELANRLEQMGHLVEFHAQAPTTFSCMLDLCIFGQPIREDKICSAFQSCSL